MDPYLYRACMTLQALGSRERGDRRLQPLERVRIQLLN
jgi:hypothetical protein